MPSNPSQVFRIRHRCSCGFSIMQKSGSIETSERNCCSFRGLNIGYRFEVIYIQEGGWLKRSKQKSHVCGNLAGFSFCPTVTTFSSIPFQLQRVMTHQGEVGHPTLPNLFGLCRHSQSTFEATASWRLACGSCCRTCDIHKLCKPLPRFQDICTLCIYCVCIYCMYVCM